MDDLSFFFGCSISRKSYLCRDLVRFWFDWSNFVVRPNHRTSSNSNSNWFGSFDHYILMVCIFALIIDIPLMSLVQWAAVNTWRSLIIDPPQMGVCPPARTSATCQGNSLGRASWPLMTRWIGASWTPFPLDNPHWQGESRKVKKTAKVKTNLKWSWCRYFATFLAKTSHLSFLSSRSIGSKEWKEFFVKIAQEDDKLENSFPKG